jgi:ABC-type glutathione transport system ATPase component
MECPVGRGGRSETTILTADNRMLLKVDNLTKVYSAPRRLRIAPQPRITALENVSFAVARGESFGVIGESGSGKSTLLRCIVGLEAPTSGSIVFDGVEIGAGAPRRTNKTRSQLQMVFQDPYSAMNPRMTVHDIVCEPMEVHPRPAWRTRRARTERARELLGLVGLESAHLGRYPHEFSGGQRQRICIARSLSLAPECLLLDEPTSALDVSVQAQVLDLLIDLQDRLSLTYILISHDLGVVRQFCDRVALIRHGRIVELAEADELFSRPTRGYARALLDAMPDPDPDRSPFRSARPIGTDPA